jgi:hypothetical protein
MRAPPDEMLATLERILGLGADVLRYADRKKGQRRTMRLVRKAEDVPTSPALCWPATPAPRPGSRPCCKTSCRAGLRPPAAAARCQAAGGGAVARQAGVHLL